VDQELEPVARRRHFYAASRARLAAAAIAALSEAAS
jgi:hypothetical protein